MTRVRNVSWLLLIVLCASAAWAQGTAAGEAQGLFERALEQALPRDTAPVAAGDVRMTLRVVPPAGRESQVAFLLHGDATTAEAMQAVSVRQEFSNWLAAGRVPDLADWTKTVRVEKANFEVTPELRQLLDGYKGIDFSLCSDHRDMPPNFTHYELWVETDQFVKDIHGYSTRGAKCAGLVWMQQLRQAVRQAVPQLESR